MPEFTPEQVQDAIENPRTGDAWGMNLPGNQWERHVMQVDVDGVWFDSFLGRTWLTDMCDTRDEWTKNVDGCTLLRRGA